MKTYRNMTGFAHTPAIRVMVAALVGLGALVFGALAHAPAAQAQSVMAMVNNRPITSFDVQQRIRLAQMTQGRRLSSKAALQELIDDQVKIIEASRIGYRVTEEGIDAEFTKLAKGGRRSDREFADALRSAGLQPSMLRESIRASIAWQSLLRDRARLGTQVTKTELESAVGEARAGTVTEYDLVQVLFVVSRGGGNLGERRRAANAARGRFTSCETGLDEFRTMRDVAVKDRITRSSADLSKQILQLLQKTPVGRMTSPLPSPQGFELIAVCDKRERADPSTSRASLAEKLTAKKFEQSSQQYLESLRKKVSIRYVR